MSDPDDQPRPTNPFATASVVVALLALALGSAVGVGAAVGLVAVVLGVGGLVRAEKNEIGLAGSLVGIAVGVLAVLWTAASFVT